MNLSVEAVEVGPTTMERVRRARDVRKLYNVRGESGHVGFGPVPFSSASTIEDATPWRERNVTTGSLAVLKGLVPRPPVYPLRVSLKSVERLKRRSRDRGITGHRTRLAAHIGHSN